MLTEDLFDQYHKEITEDLKIDEINLKDKLFDLPCRRHYWVGRLMFHKQQILRLNRKKAEAAKLVKQQIEGDSPVILNARSIAEAVEAHEVMVKINEEIAHHELLVDFLLRVESNFRTASYDLKNLVEVIKLETT